MPVTILTDHKNLEYFSEKRHLSERQIRYAERLSKFVFKVVYRAGMLNGAADALFWIVPPEGGDSVLHEPILPPIKPMALKVATVETTEPMELTRKIQAMYDANPATWMLIEKLERDPTNAKDYAIEGGLLFHKGVIIVPADAELQHEILVQCHDTPTAGHFGIQKTFELVSRMYEWANLRAFVKKYVSTCDTCLRNKTS